VSTFTYRAVDAEGIRLQGQAEASSLEELIRERAAEGMIILEAAPTEEGGRSALPGNGLSRRRAVVDVTRSLAALLPAGVPLARALAVSAKVAGGAVADVLRNIQQRIERGDLLATALAEHPRFFPPHYVGLVRAGERSGDLAGAFSRLADQLEREEALRGRLVSASIYPLLLAAVGGIAVVVLLLFVLPRFAELLMDTGAALPRSTAFLLATSSGLSRFWPLILLGAGGLLFFAGVQGRTEAGRRVIGTVMLHLPLIRGVRCDALAGRFARLLGILLGGGAPILAALEDTGAGLSDPLVRDEAERIRARVREGVSLHLAIAEGGFFPPVLGQLVAVGEEAGRLDEFLIRAADLLEERTERTLQRLVTLLEPAMIVGFGTVVAVVALSLLQAIYGVNAGAFR
jgi:general secretion pathway protein F